MNSALYNKIKASQGRLGEISAELIESSENEASDEILKKAQNNSEAKHISLRGWVIRITYMCVTVVFLSTFLVASANIMVGVQIYADSILGSLEKTTEFLRQTLEYFLVAASVLFVRDFSKRIRR